MLGFVKFSRRVLAGLVTYGLVAAGHVWAGGGPRLQAGAIELGLSGALTTTEGISSGALGTRGTYFWLMAGGVLGVEGALYYQHVGAMDAVDAEAALSWQLRAGDSGVYPFLAFAGGVRREEVGSFGETRYPAGFGVGLRSLIGSRAAFRVEYQYRRILDDPVDDYSEGRWAVGLSVLFRNADATVRGRDGKGGEPPQRGASAATDGRSRADEAPSADLIVYGGVVRTLDSSLPVAEAVAIRDDRVVRVGATEDVRALEGPTTRVIDASGLTVLPGLIDAHGHLPSFGRSLRELDVTGTGSKGEVRSRVLDYAARIGPGAWVYGSGWDQNDWAEKAFPTWSDLEGTEQNPVYLKRIDGHAAWLNRTAMDQLGIDEGTVDPEGGRVVRGEDGKVTGVLIDRAAEDARRGIPKPSFEERVERMRAAIRECNRYGLTGVHDAGIGRDDLAALEHLLKSGELTLRVYCMLDSDEPEFVQGWLERGPWADPTGHLTVRAVKIYADGALGSRGAALLEPYADDPENRGLPQHARAVYDRWARACRESGFQLCIHAIGDAGNRLALDVCETVLGTRGQDARFRVEHAQVLAEADIRRFARLGVIACVQPTHATSDMYWAEERVGPERIKGAYAWRSLLDSGAVVACGSDFPVESANPLWGLYAAVTRRDHAGWPADGWYRDQVMTRQEAIAGFSTRAAFAEFAENSKGRIAVGAKADLTILDVDPFISPVERLLDGTAYYTIVGGRVVHEAPTTSTKE